MQSVLLVRLRPLGAWRYGPGDGGHDRVDQLYRSDRLFSAVTLAMRQLGWHDEWLDATVGTAHPALAFSSLFPYQGETLFAIPPTTLWPPPAGLVTAPSPIFLSKIRWNAARFVPLSVIDSLLSGQSILADQWIPDVESGCLLRRDRPSSSPLRVVVRDSAAVDRLHRSSHNVSTLACVEFEQGSGLWTVVRFRDEGAHSAWTERLKSAFRLLADSGFGGGRTKGWGQTQPPEFQTGAWPALLLPKVGRLQRNGNHAEDSESTNALYWLLSLYSPARSDQVDWSGGDYRPIVRSGRIESPAATGSLKKTVRMIAEGYVLSAATEPVGAAVDVAPDGLSHPVYRSGIALALRLPSPKQIGEGQPVEVGTPLVEEAPIEVTEMVQPSSQTEGEALELPSPEPVSEPDKSPEEPDYEI